MKFNLKTAYVGICMTIIVIGVILSLYQAYWPIKVIEIHSPLKVPTKVVKAGSVLVYTGDYCQFRTFPATVSRTLVNNSAIQLPIVNTVGSLGCHTVNIQVPVPFGSEPGQYHLEGIVTYRISPNRSITASFYTEEFQIVK